jgi:Na+/H+ antiporter NhaD/arsenite permease-like protein
VPADDPFWHLVAYCAGTGGSLLIIGSAAGVAFMSLEKVNFMWFLKKISFAALLGYIAGIAVFQMI